MANQLRRLLSNIDYVRSTKCKYYREYKSGVASLILIKVKMSIPVIQPRALFGLRLSIPRNVFYVTDFEILYPCGAVIILHKFTERHQKYIKLMERSVRMDYMAISPKRFAYILFYFPKNTNDIYACFRTLCGVVENSDSPQVLIYDLDSLKRKRTLTLPTDATAKRIECIDFTHDERYVMVLSGDPDWMMYAYNWERGKIETSTRANYMTNPGPVSRVCTHGYSKKSRFEIFISNECHWP